jgi:hypothetical protein
MKNKCLFVILLGIFVLSGITSALGELQSRAGGKAIYDTDLRITYLANPNLALTETFGVNYISLGRMNWNTANEYIDEMNAYEGTGYLGCNKWRLPNADPDCAAYSNDCDNSISELGHLKYDVSELDLLDLLEASPEPDWYWTKTMYPFGGLIWAFNFRVGQQAGRNDFHNNHYLWPVADGDMGVVSSGCLWDLDEPPDGDVDGLELAYFVATQFDVNDFENFALEFGRTDCLD